jgi:hypothetical protein
MSGILPVWTGDMPEPPADDPIGCPVSIEQMSRYLGHFLPFEFLPRKLEFVQSGKLEENQFWLWAFYGDDGHRWNLIVFSDPPPGRPKRRTWMCADNNPHALNDDEYIVAIHNKDY